MLIVPTATPGAIARASPATIRVFQRLRVDVCRGGRRSLADVCASRGLDVEAVIAELRAAERAAGRDARWKGGTLAALLGHIRVHDHRPIRQELPRLAGMMALVLDRHGDRLPDVLTPLRQAFVGLQEVLLADIAGEGDVLFPALLAIESQAPAPFTRPTLVAGPIRRMTDDHDDALEALGRMRRLTAGYAPPEWACPTFRGLYFGLAGLERDVERHVQLVDAVLVPQVGDLAVR